MGIPKFTKVFTYGDRWTKGILDGPVEITEKYDGSQFNFGRVNDIVHMASKGAQVFFEDNNKMFNKAKDFVKLVQDRLPNGVVLHGEYLQSPRHNTLQYSRTPKNNFALFGVTLLGETRWLSTFEEIAKLLDCEAISVVTTLNSPETQLEDLHKLIPAVSALGGCQAEGIVIKNYAKSVMVGDLPYFPLCAKIVTAEFKEVHGISWKQSNPDNLTKIGEALNTGARWNKAIQYLRDSGKLEHSLRDIGPLLKRIQEDIETEAKEDIKDMLWKLFKKDVLRKAVAGFPEYWKEYLSKEIENVGQKSNSSS